MLIVDVFVVEIFIFLGCVSKLALEKVKRKSLQSVFAQKLKQQVSKFSEN